MTHRPQRTAAPAADPVSLAEAKAHLRVDSSAEDTLIGSLVSASVAALDGYTGILGRCMVTQTWAQRFDDWSTVLRLPFPDVSSVAVTYTDTDNTTQTVASSLYDLFEDARGAYIRFKDEFSSPSLGPDWGGITVSLVSGYGDASAVPAALKAAVLLHVGTLDKHRETLSDSGEPNFAHDALIAPYRRVL